MVALGWEEARDAPVQGGRIRLWLQERLAEQQGRAFLWAPIALTFGIWIYFALMVEPSWLALSPLGVIAAALLWLGRFRPWLLIVALVPVGLLLAKAGADNGATPVLRMTMPEKTVTGTVEDRALSGRGRQTFVLRVEAIEGVVPAETPLKLRISASAKQGEVKVGSHVSFKAFLAPLPTPVFPGGFDYGRQLWLDGIGGTGRAVGPITASTDAPPWSLWLDAKLEDVRGLIGGRIRAVLQGTDAAIAEALITGERSAIPKDVNLSFQISGLAHVLSISGLHMALAAGGVFWLVRAMLAAFPRLALNFPIKKWAAAAALLAGFFYMLLAGSGTATQRSYIMIAVMFFAMLVDRPAVSVRNLALAAVIILVLQPDAAISASFQMSFMAVLGLTAFYEFWREWKQRRGAAPVEQRHWGAKIALRIAGGVVAALVTTIIAGAMSSIPAAYHFGRLSPYSILGNGLALPVISLIIMPSALASVILMPLGLEHWPLWLMGKGIALMMAISDWVAHLPDAALLVPQLPALNAITLATGAALFCLLRGRLRLVGPVIALSAVLMPHAAALPDILVDRTGVTMAFRNEAGDLVPAPGRKGRFSVEKWLVANGDETPPAEAVKRVGWACDQTACTAKVSGKALAFWRVENSPGACDGIDILIAAFPLRRACPDIPIRIDRFDLWRNGAHGIRIAGDDTLTVETARGLAGDRPWSQKPLPRKGPYVKR
ncbi:ComEC/Rec2 family competence protein [Aestuariivirga sp.]|uniref:ComEC/Rec2 family competence protein n=1 Tax=Aestuariivirga sp. TaxID=2650926 RepID=UPI0039E5831A